MPGKHTIEIRGGPSTHASAYVNATYYLPRTDPSVTASSVRSGDAESLRYSVQFDGAVNGIAGCGSDMVVAGELLFRLPQCM